MRKFLVVTAFAGVIAATAVIGTAARAQPYYGGMMGGYGGGYGPGYGHMGGYGPGYGHRGGYGPGWGMMGPGYGYGRGYGYGERYRGKRLCWRQNSAGRGYYAPCR
jgi:hypothetical protein